MNDLGLIRLSIIYLSIIIFFYNYVSVMSTTLISINKQIAQMII